MADVVWNFKFLSQLGFKILSDVVSTQSIPVAIPTAFLMQAGSFHIAFEGNFTVNGYALTGGTITGFKAFDSGVLVLEATGYSIDAKAFQTSFASSPFVTFLHLTDMPKTMNGSGQSDVLGGGFDGLDEHPDRLFGNGGNDELSGGGGDDFMSGGTGHDVLEGGPGSDTADYSEKLDSVVVTLANPVKSIVKVGGIEEDELFNVENVIGGSGNDAITGDGLVNMLVGNDGDDRLSGGDGNDRLQGGAGRDRIDGGKDNDEIDSGEGKDALTGGKSSDSFAFSTTLDANGNLDKITDFKPGADSISLIGAVFSAFDPGGLKGKYFAIGTKAKDGNDHVIYDDQTGMLSYDSDGKGGLKQIAFAKLKGSPAIGADDFQVL
jgi:Ca2+-binding RTX toxin-like protein